MSVYLTTGYQTSALSLPKGWSLSGTLNLPNESVDFQFVVYPLLIGQFVHKGEHFR